MEKTCVIALSESGETSQTLKIVQKLKGKRLSSYCHHKYIGINIVKAI
ncbi:hypothetical protein SMSK321_0512 [Streptococcus mitis SK321]|nr:hypothetical protein SMSK321_0512 [Streptococcus mitis SK321]